MVDNNLFRKALRMAAQVAGEKVANADQTFKRKGPFDAFLSGELKAEISAMGIDVNELTENEKTALIHAYCMGWNIEVDAKNW